MRKSVLDSDIFCVYFLFLN